ncbi:MAG: AI-2E family transporter [Acidobacteriota bacterium]
MIPNPSALQPNAIAPEQAAAPTDQPTGGRESVVIDDPVHVRSVMVSIIAVLAVVLMLQYAQSVLIPIVIGIVISYVLAPLVKNLERARIPRSIGAAVAVSVLVGGLGIGVYTLSDQVMATISSVPVAAQRLRERLRSHRSQRGGALQKVQEAAKEIDKAAQEAARSDDAAKGPSVATGVQQVEVVPASFKASDYLWSGGLGLLGFAGQFVLILFLVYFFLVTGDLYKRKLVKIAGPTLTHKKITVQILDDINAQIQSFIRVQAFTSLVVAVATSAALWGFGFEQYVIWGVFAGVFNSIPYVGPLVVTAGVGVVAFLQFDDALRTIYVCAAAFGITSLEGFLLTPWLMSRAAQMNPVAIFVGLLFWSWVWGLWGTILAVPLLMMLKAVCDHVEDLRSIGELLGE